MRTALKLIIGVLCLALVLGIGMSILRQYQISSCADLAMRLQSSPIHPAWIFLALSFGSSLGFIPGALVSLSAGALLGFATAFASVISGIWLGAVLVFCFARFMFHDWFKQRVMRHRKIQLLEHLYTRGLSLEQVIILRLIPIVPFNLFSLFCGVIALSPAPFLLGTVLGIMPGSYLMIRLGQVGCTVLDNYKNKADLADIWMAIPTERLVEFGLFTVGVVSLYPLFRRLSSLNK